MSKICGVYNLEDWQQQYKELGKKRTCLPCQ